MTEAVRVILREHRSIAAVLHGLLFLVGEIRDRNARPDFTLLRAMLYYIDAFPERLHHPKEDRYLFPRLQARTREADGVIAKLEEQHAQGAELTRQLEQAIVRYEEEGASGFQQFASLVERYTEFYWQHMREEEDVLLPIAERALTREDWREIDAVFTGHADPLVGEDVKEDFQKLFHRIAMLAPPPIGLGSGGKAARE